MLFALLIKSGCISTSYTVAHSPVDVCSHRIDFAPWSLFFACSFVVCMACRCTVFIFSATTLESASTCSRQTRSPIQLLMRHIANNAPTCYSTISCNDQQFISGMLSFYWLLMGRHELQYWSHVYPCVININDLVILIQRRIKCAV